MTQALLGAMRWGIGRHIFMINNPLSYKNNVKSSYNIMNPNIWLKNLHTKVLLKEHVLNFCFVIQHVKLSSCVSSIDLHILIMLVLNENKLFAWSFNTYFFCGKYSIFRNCFHSRITASYIVLSAIIYSCEITVCTFVILLQNGNLRYEVQQKSSVTSMAVMKIFKWSLFMHHLFELC